MSNTFVWPYVPPVYLETDMAPNRSRRHALTVLRLSYPRGRGTVYPAQREAAKCRALILLAHGFPSI